MKILDNIKEITHKDIIMTRNFKEDHWPGSLKENTNQRRGPEYFFQKLPDWEGNAAVVTEECTEKINFKQQGAGEWHIFSAFTSY